MLSVVAVTGVAEPPDKRNSPEPTRVAEAAKAEPEPQPAKKTSPALKKLVAYK
jgi:hypothetical protein